MSHRYNTRGQDGRSVALRVALKTQQALDLQVGLNREIDASGLQGREKNLATELAYGYARYKGRIDWIIASFLTKTNAKLPDRFLPTLGHGVYELLFLDRVPDYAAVDCYVQRIRKSWGKPLAGLANAVLRRVGREKKTLASKAYYWAQAPDHETFFSRYYSCPEWLVRILVQSQGLSEAESILKRSLHPPLIGVRVNQRLEGYQELYQRLAADKGAVLQHPPGIGFFKTPDGIADLERRGLLSRQSLAAQTMLAGLDPSSWPQPVWDACAGHGGKSGQLLEMGLQVIASDRVPHKARLCRQELHRLFFPESRVFAADAAQAYPLQKNPGTILLDVPCSGLGVLSRRPDIKWKRTPEDIARLLVLQRQLVRLACESIGSQGRVVYLTCSLNRAENQDQIINVVKRFSDSIRLVQEYSSPSENALGEYFYAAILRKK